MYWDSKKEEILLNRYPIGTKVQLFRLSKEHRYQEGDKIPDGIKGVVTGYKDLSLHVLWDNGRKCNIKPFDGDWLIKI